MLRLSEGQFSKIRGAKAPATTGECAPYTVKFAKRVDKNQPAIVKTLRHLGFMVHHLHEVGGGMFDLLCSKHGLNFLVEVKDGTKFPSARELTRAQKKFHFAWQGMRCVVTCGQDCVDLNLQVNAIGRAMKEHGIATEIRGSRERMYEPSLH